ncbi:MAG TPA: GNAT family protein [Sporolactobacillaceae bacterium]|nr:GNAT family protein [Sporolactobacillaceae bacterium]
MLSYKKDCKKEGKAMMDFSFKKMTQAHAEEIAYTWRYEGIYSFYDMEADQEDLNYFLDPNERGEQFYSVFNGDDLIGFFCFTRSERRVIDLGLGLRPELTGKGLGHSFLNKGLQFAQHHYNPEKVTLSVAAFNKRAIHVYKKAGFQPEQRVKQATNGGEFDFLRMSLSL